MVLTETAQAANTAKFWEERSWTDAEPLSAMALTMAKVAPSPSGPWLIICTGAPSSPLSATTQKLVVGEIFAKILAYCRYDKERKGGVMTLGSEAAPSFLPQEMSKASKVAQASH